MRRTYIPLLLTIGAALAPALAAREMSLEAAVERVQKDVPGRVLTAEEVHIGRKKLYRIKLLTRDGRVQVVQVPADDKEKQ